VIPRGALVVLAALLGQPSENVTAPAVDLGAPEFYAPALRDDTDLLLLPAARRPPPLPTVIAATRAKARPELVTAAVLDLAMIRQALPSLVRADVVATRPGPRPDGWPDRLIAWELEIPLFNLKGKAWLQQRGWIVEINLVEGAFAPGRVRFRVKEGAATTSTVAPTVAPTIASTIVTCELQVDFRASNFVLRRVARHDPWAESAMSAAVAWVLVRAVTLRAESQRAGPVSRPRGRIEAPAANALDGSWLGDPTLASLRAAGTLAAVRRAPGGRLAWASVEVPIPGPATTVASRLIAPETWRVFPGLASVTRRRQFGANDPLAATPSAVLIEVDDNVAFVDLDAIWSIGTTGAARATAVDGAIRGAVLGWDAWPGDRIGSALAVLSLHPRLDAAGFIERRLIEAEPLLEHALAVALAYVDAAAVADSFAPRSGAH
jgi:hypothetical protein